MREIKETALIFVILALVFTRAHEVETDEDIVTIEEENYEVNNELKDKRILWPYPLNTKSDPPTTDKEQHGTMETATQKTQEDKRKKRFLPWYPHNFYVDTMMQTLSYNQSVKFNDPFDFIRDSYPLPKGERFFSNMYIFLYS